MADPAHSTTPAPVGVMRPNLETASKAPNKRDTLWEKPMSAVPAENTSTAVPVGTTLPPIAGAAVSGTRDTAAVSRQRERKKQQLLQQQKRNSATKPTVVGTRVPHSPNQAKHSGTTATSPIHGNNGGGGGRVDGAGAGAGRGSSNSGGSAVGDSSSSGGGKMEGAPGKANVQAKKIPTNGKADSPRGTHTQAYVGFLGHPNPFVQEMQCVISACSE